LTAIAAPAGGTPAPEATFVYVANAEDGDIGTYQLLDSGELKVGPRVKVAPMVMPMAVSPDRRFLYAVSRAQPLSVHVLAIDAGTGTLTPVSTSPLVDSFPYVALDKTGRFLLAASYAGNLVGVYAVGADGSVAGEPLQVIPVGRNAHSIGVDETNRFVYVPALGSDAIFMFTFDAKSGRLHPNIHAAHPMKAMSGPRHFVTSVDNRFLYVLSEFLCTVTTLAIDGTTGLLTEVSSASGLPPDSGLIPGAPRGPNPERNLDHDIWAADVHLTPNGKFLYVSERTSSTVGAFSVDGASGRLTYLASTPTERQPRGFAIDPGGRFLVSAGEKSATISVYAIDPGTGALRFLNKYPTGKGANWVEIVRCG